MSDTADEVRWNCPECTTTNFSEVEAGSSCGMRYSVTSVPLNVAAAMHEKKFSCSECHAEYFFNSTRQRVNLEYTKSSSGGESKRIPR